MKVFTMIVVLLLTTASHAITSTGIDIIPAPAAVKILKGQFELRSNTKIAYSKEADDVAEYLSSRLRVATGYDLKLKAINSSKRPKSSNTISLIISGAETNVPSKKEGYYLNVRSKSIVVYARDGAGLFYGVQSLLQLLPPEIESVSKVEDVKWSIPCVEITDEPRFAWRGLLLDVSRHFFTKDEVKQYIDTMAHYKLNTFHWHLTDDQGWRIEIKKYPKLTEIGAWRVPRQGNWWSFDPPQPGEKATYGGFYTQEDIAEIVEYARLRFVTIVPEIDVPGHSMAALASYPELSCGGGPFEVNPGSKFYRQIENTLCPSNDKVYQFLDDVFSEIAGMFPGQYIHMGGDEAHKGFWAKCQRCQEFKKQKNIKNEHELQSYFVKQVEKTLESKGKKLIGWDEILEGGLAPNATVMSWRGISGGVRSAQMGHNVVMTPSPYYYLDLYQSDPIVEPATYSMCRLTDAYNLEPVPEGVKPELILGVQGNVWTESISEMRHAQYMTWPRGLAIAETAWSPKARKDWVDFTNRVEDQFRRMDNAQVKYARSMYDPIIKSKRDDQNNLLIEISTEVEGIDIHYTFDGEHPDNFYPKYEKPLTVPLNAPDIIVTTYRNGKKMGKQIKKPMADLEKQAPKK